MNSGSVNQIISQNRKQQLTPQTASDLAPWDTEPDSLLPSQLKVIEDIYYAGLGDEHIALLERLQIQACITLPIVVGGQPWGLLCIQQCAAPRQWQGSELSFLQEITAQLSVAIQQANHLSQAQQKSERLQQLLDTVQEQKQQQARATVRERLVSRMIQQIHKTRDIAEILETATEETRNLLKCEHVLVYRFRPDWSREIAHEACLPGCTPLMDQPQYFSWVDRQLQLHQGGRYRDRESAVVMDIYQTDYSDEHIACLEQRGIRAFMIVPIFTGEQLWGLMGAYQSGSPRDWSFEELSFLERISGQLGVAFQQAELLKQLEQAKEKADSANQAKGTFLAHMSHELRTPLNAILGFSQLMHREPETTPSQRETLNIINRSGNHLLSLINDILEMSKIEAGKLVLQEADLDLFSLCDSVHDLFRLKAQSKGLALHVERAVDVPRYIHCDERKLRQILMNLISNSLKFTHSGSITLKIWRGESVRLDPMTSLSNAPIQLCFSIQDTGEGIAAQDMAQLFDAFSQTESGRSLQEGSGLGLPISREFVQLMGGELTLESERYRGTEARFSIVVPPVVGKFTPSPANQRVSSLAPHQPDYRILVVEDRQENRKLLTQLMECVGFSVRTATNGELAIAAWQDWKPHLIWMDLQMPVMDGFEATRRIRHLEAAQQQADPAANPAANSAAAPAKAVPSPPTVDRETFILAITASAFEETRTLTLEAGFDDFIRKPYSESLIFDKITQYLGVKYCYETIETATVPVSALLADSPQELPQANLEQQVQAMAPSWRQALYHAAITLDEAALQKHIQEIDPAYGALKALLQNWAQLLRLDKIATLMAGAIQASSSMPDISSPNST